MASVFMLIVFLTIASLSSSHPLLEMGKRASVNVSFDELPLEPSDPKYPAWGLWGKNDQLGRTNLVTAEITRQAAASNIRTGEVIPLKWVPGSRSLEGKAHTMTACHWINPCVP